MMALLGVTLAIPAALISGFAPTIEVLIVGRLFGGFAAGMAYPTTLALIAALWGAGAARTRSIALWAAIGGAISVSGPLLSGLDPGDPHLGLGLLGSSYRWRLAIVLALKFIPAHVNEATEPVDNLGGILSVVLVGTFVLSLNFLPVAGYQTVRGGPAGDFGDCPGARSSSGSGAPRTRCMTSRSPDAPPSGWQPWAASSSSAR